MHIQSLQWANPGHNSIIVNNGEGEIPWPCETYHQALVDAFVASGGKILAAPASRDYDWDGMRWLLNLDRVKARTASQIDRAAGETSVRYITNRPGQEATYLRKAEQARAHKAAGYPADLVPYPLLQVELDAIHVSMPAATGQQVTDYILQTEAIWALKMAEIERARRIGKEKVRVSTTEAAVIAARDEAIAALGAM